MKNVEKKLSVWLLVVFVFTSTLPISFAQTTSEANIVITEGTGTTVPVEPEEPETPLEGGEETDSTFAIVYISDFTFAGAETSGLALKRDITTYQPNIQVVDLRGTGTGWSVSAKTTGFVSLGFPSLPGSTIRFIDGRPNSLVSPLYAPTQITDVALPTDNAPRKIITAGSGKGMGLWIMRWYPALPDTSVFVRLEIPAGVATVGTHTAIINWTLENTP